MGKLIRWLFLGLVTIAVGTIAAVYIYLQSSRPVYHGELYNRGVFEEVKVFFDKYGIPHIFAQNEKDAYFTLGYLQAQERLFQMELLRRVGAGRLSEIFGPDFVHTDAFFRTLGIAKSAKESATMFFSRPNESWQKNTLSFLKGVNAFVFQGPTPPEFLLLGIPKAPFTPEDIYLISGYMSFSFTEAFRTDPILEQIKNKLGPAYLTAFEGVNLPPPDSGNATVANPSDSILSDLSQLSNSVSSIVAGLPLAPWLGSNAWVIAPAHSTSGGVLFANDTHIGFQQPEVWYEAHMDYPGETNYGRYLAGLPFPLVGHTRNIAWGLTMFENDDINLYREQTDPVHPGQFKYKGSWHPFIVRSETISIKGRPDTTIIIRESVHGPVINAVEDHLDSLETNPVSVWWTFTKFPITALQVTSSMISARGIDDARNAASMVHAPGLNVIYGDNMGNIAWWAAAKLPRYKSGTNTKFILDGSSGEDDIEGYLDFANNPHSENPSEGFIISANQKPDLESGNFYPGYYAPPARADRIRELIKAKEKWDLEGLKTVQTDVISKVHAALAKQIIGIIGHETLMTLSPLHRRAAGILLKWNGSHRISDLGPTIYYRVLANILEKSMKDELGTKNFETIVNTHLMKNSYKRFISDSLSAWWDDITTPGTRESRRDIILSAYTKAIDDLALYSKEMTEWTWGAVHTLEHVHPLGKQKPLDKIFNVGPDPAPGGIETINNAGFPMNIRGRYPVSYGPAMRTLIDLNDPEAGESISPTGQSGHVRSPHYADQHILFLNGKYRPMMMNRTVIESSCLNILTFKPAR